MYVDALLQILVPVLNEIEGMETTEPVYEWEGTEYSQGPTIVTWRDISLRMDPPLRYPWRLLPPGYISDNWTWLSVSDGSLNEYEEFINREGDDTLPTLESFLRLTLAGLERWAVSFLLQRDQIDNVCETDVEGMIVNLRTCLDRIGPKKGFIAYK